MCACTLERVLYSGESVPAALDASNTQRYSSENHYTEVTAEISPSASVLPGKPTLSVSRTHTHTHTLGRLDRHVHPHRHTDTHAQFPDQLIALRATNYANNPH